MAELENKSVKRTLRSSPISDFAGQAREVTGDLLELVELQVKLARLDARDAAERVIRPVVFLLGAVCLAIAALPVVFVGLAGWLAHATDLMPWAAQLIVGLAGALLAAVTAWFSVRTITTAASTFERSGRELSQNIAWVKSVFRKSKP